MASELLAIIISIIFQLQPKWQPWRLIFNSTEESSWTMKQAINFKLTATTRIARIPLTPAIFILTKWIFNIAAFGYISPADTDSKIKWTIAFTSCHKLTVKESGPH
ncbi:hypothetical protein AHML_15470 [Aeromonas hydrophila ML09-119]|nr:hypothetical protein AHML_15470 [Aeromonas hydrophila ML09-119]